MTDSNCDILVTCGSTEAACKTFEMVLDVGEGGGTFEIKINFRGQKDKKAQNRLKFHNCFWPFLAKLLVTVAPKFT